MAKPAFSLPRMVMLNSAIGLISPLLTLWFAREWTWTQLGRSTISGQVYSHCIGTLAHLAMFAVYPQVHYRPVIIRWSAVAVVFVLVTAAGALAASGILLGAGMLSPQRFRSNLNTSFRFGLIITFIFGIAGVTLNTLKAQLERASLELRTKELERERALTLATQSRLSSLESRVHPHFLFNALNSISSLIREDPERAERLLGRMAALLRFSLDATQLGFVLLEQEMTLVSDYLEIEKARFGSRLTYSIEVDPALLQIRVPPMSVQTLVENSVKHSIGPRREGGSVRVTTAGEGDRILLEVRDDGPGFEIGQAAAGHGLDLLQSRLETMYHSQASLTAAKLDGGMVVRITIPKLCRESAA